MYIEITTNPAIIGVKTAISRKLKVLSSFFISSLKLFVIDFKIYISKLYDFFMQD